MIARHLVLAMCAITCLLTTPAVAQALAPPTPPAAVQYLTIDDAGDAPIPVAIWGPPAGSAALVILSHGTSGNLDSHSDTAQALAEAGFVVVALTHPGDNFRDLSSVGKPNWFVDRSRHVSRAIDFMFTRWDGRARLIPDRVGVFGFSAGGTTALISIGGAPDFGRLPAHCAQRLELVCGLMDPPPAGDRAPPPWVHDRRVAAAVVIAPGFGFTFAPPALANVSAPVQLWSGTDDDIVPPDSNTEIVRRSLPRAPEFHSVPGAVHYSFLKPCRADTPSDLCKDSPGFDRLAFHQALNRSVIGFFREHLTGTAQAGRP